MATGTDKNGVTVSVNAHVSIIGKVVSVSGTGSLASVVVQAPYDAGTFTIVAHDAGAVQQLNDANHVALSVDGKSYGTAGDDLTARGVVTGITGSGQSAILAVKLNVSGNSINTAAGNVTSVADVS
jgi:hypothetical protein